jgi:hypothetical protein
MCAYAYVVTPSFSLLRIKQYLWLNKICRQGQAEAGAVLPFSFASFLFLCLISWQLPNKKALEFFRAFCLLVV